MINAKNETNKVKINAVGSLNRLDFPNTKLLTRMKLITAPKKTLNVLASK